MSLRHPQQTSRQFHIAQTAHSFLNQLGPNTLTHTTINRTSSPAIDCSLTIPNPPSIQKELIAAGILPYPAQRLSEGYHHHALQLKAEYERRMQICAAAWADTLNGTSDGRIRSLQLVYVSHYTQTLKKWKETFVREASARVFFRSEITPHDSLEKRYSFKQEAVPVLEQAFLQNQFPTREDKINLTKQVGMELRQIHVWFQNRRSRFRREGGQLKKHGIIRWPEDKPASPRRDIIGAATDLSTRPRSRDLAQSSIKKEEPVIPHSWGPESRSDQEIDSSLPSSKSDGQKDTSPDPFAWEAPSHAFPTPHLTGSDCLSNGMVSFHFETPWPRKPAQQQIRHVGPVDINSLSNSIARMSLGSHAQGLPSAPRPRHTPCIGFTVPCPPAPLPSLFPRTTTPTLAPALKQGSVRPPSSKSHVARTKARSASKVNIPPIQAPSRRRGAQLPKRVPKSTPTLVREKTHPYECSLSRKSSSSSLSSVSSSRSRLSSYSSDDSSLPPTPPSLPVDLPQNKPSSSDFAFDAISHVGRLFSSSLADEPRLTPDSQPWISRSSF